MNTQKLLDYKPYTVTDLNLKNGYANIAFEKQNVITIPSDSSTTMVKLLNDAFRNGVKHVMKNVSIQDEPEPVVKSKPMPLEELHPIYTSIKSKH
jgi:hypothetical protein